MKVATNGIFPTHITGSHKNMQPIRILTVCVKVIVSNLIEIIQEIKS
jgi:hypothetical protein